MRRISPGGGFPGGGGHGGHGGRPPPEAARRPGPAQGGVSFEPLERLLRTAIELRQSMLLDATQTQRWADMQTDLRDALEKRRALTQKPADPALVANPAVLFVQDMAGAENALGASLEKLSHSMQRAFDTLDAQQRRLFAEKMSAALRPEDP